MQVMALYCKLRRTIGLVHLFSKAEMQMSDEEKNQLNFVTLFLFSHQNDDDDDDPRLSTQSAFLSRPPADVCQGKNKS